MNELNSVKILVDKCYIVSSKCPPVVKNTRSDISWGR